MVRHGRQIALAEVGVAGQARIEATRVNLALEGLAAQVAVRYLAGAGVGCLRVPDELLAQAARSVEPNARVEIATALVADSEPEPLSLRDPVARDLARGAHFALRVLRSAIRTTS
ncbi:MAG: hypothetical protein ACLP1X_30295 [Polyangiaceae bacterium]|jgi:hypothetical protein